MARNQAVKATNELGWEVQELTNNGWDSCIVLENPDGSLKPAPLLDSRGEALLIFEELKSLMNKNSEYRIYPVMKPSRK